MPACWGTARCGGGDRDVAIFRQAVGGDTLTDETFKWNLPPALQSYFAFPAYVNQVPGFRRRWTPWTARTESWTASGGPMTWRRF